MATLVTTADYFTIGIDDYTALPYEKNGNIKMGGYASRAQYCWEILLDPDFSLIPAGSTITSISADVNITDYQSGNTPVALSIMIQDKGSWVDNGSDEPTRVKPAFFDESGTDNEFTQVLTQKDVPVDFTGILTLDSTQTFVDWANDVLNGVQPDNGMMLTHYPDYYAYYITADQIQFTVEYESGGGPTRRRVMIIS